MTVPLCYTRLHANKTDHEKRWSVLLPLDPVEDRAQALSLVGVDRFDEGYTALQVHPKAGVPIAVLALRTQANTVGEYRLETIEVGSHDIHAPIGNQPRQVLPDALAHDARLAVVHGKTLFVQDGGHVGGEALHAAVKCFAARKQI